MSNKLFETFIQGISASALSLLLEELSGEREVLIGGVKRRLLSRNTFCGGAETTVQYFEEYYAGLGLTSQRHHYTLRELPALNLIAELIGDDTPEEVVYVGSHFDSTAGKMWTEELVAPGADDDGSGTVAAMVTAAMLIAMKKAGYRIARTVKFPHFSGEEQQLAGSKAYVRDTDVSRAVAMFQLEMMGYTGDGSNRVDLQSEPGNERSAKLATCMSDVVAEYGLALKLFKGYRDDRSSDHRPFMAAGVPVLCISEDFNFPGLNPKMHTVEDRVGNMQTEYWAEVVRMVVAGVAVTAGVYKA